MRKLSQAQINVLQRGIANGYKWVEVPNRRNFKSLPENVRRSFGLVTINKLLRLGYIRYQPARIYVTGKGRKALKNDKP